jgi:hypothetical protein
LRGMSWRGGNHGWSWAEAERDIANGATQLRVTAEAASRNLQKGRRQLFWQNRIGVSHPFPDRNALRQCLDQGHSKRPYVARRREPSAWGLGCVIDAGFANAHSFIRAL